MPKNILEVNKSAAGLPKQLYWTIFHMSSHAVMHPSKFNTAATRVQLHCCRDKIVFWIYQGNHTLEVNNGEACFLFHTKSVLSGLVQTEQGNVCRSAQFCSTAASLLLLLNIHQSRQVCTEQIVHFNRLTKEQTRGSPISSMS